MRPILSLSKEAYEDGGGEVTMDFRTLSNPNRPKPKTVPRPFIKRLALAYVMTTVLLSNYIALHIPTSSYLDDLVGATTTISHRSDIYAAWLIAVLAAIAIGRVRVPRWPRIILLVASFLLILIFIVSSVELDLRRTYESPNWIVWSNENAWIQPYPDLRLPDNLSKVFVPGNFTLKGVVLSIVSIANTFRELTWYWAVVPIIDTRFSLVGWPQLASLVLLFSGSLMLLSVAVAVVVTALQDIDASTYHLAERVSSVVASALQGISTLAVRGWKCMSQLVSRFWKRFSLPVNRAWEHLSRPVSRTWRKLRATLGWIRLQRVLIVLLVMLIGLDVIGVLRAARLNLVRWNQFIPTGLPLTGLPSTSTVKELVVGPDGESLFAVTLEHGVFRTDDSGQTWQLAGEGMGPYVRTLTIGPDGKSLFAVNVGDRVFRSDDNGRTWQPTSQELIVASVWTLIGGPDAKSLFAGTIDSGVLRSDDDGQTWQSADQGLKSQLVLVLAVEPDGKSILAGVVDAAVVRSDNEGTGSWFQYRVPQMSIFRSDDGGQTWQASNQGIVDQPVSTLVVGPDGKSLFAGTLAGGKSRGGVFRSDDGGRTWQSAGLADQEVWKLAVGPDGKSLFAAVTREGVFRSDDDGQTWQPANQGLGGLRVLTLAVGPNGKSLFAGTLEKGIFRSDDNGQTWQAMANPRVLSLMVGPDGKSLFSKIAGDKVFRSDDGGQTWKLNPTVSFAEDIVSGDVKAKVEGGKISLTRPGMGWMRCATYSGAASASDAPLSTVIHESTVTLYAMPTTEVFLWCEVPLPTIWSAPTPYLMMVATTWQFLDWAAANAFPISTGLGTAMAILAAYIYVGVARPNRLRPASVLWLLPRPRHLLAASAYRGYMERWVGCDALERLILLQGPTDAPFTPAQLEADLRQLGAAFDAEGLLAALSALVQRGLLVRENGTWRLAEPLLAQFQRQEISPKESARLAELTRQEHPLYAEARRFLAQAGFTVRPADPFGFLCTSDQPVWADVSLLYVQLVLERTLDLEEFQSLCTAAEAAYGEDVRGHTAAVVIDRPPRAGDLYQIFAVRAQQGFTVVPLPRSLMVQARLAGREIEALREQVELYTGRTDLYDIRTTVTDVLSFFGRGGLLAELERRLTYGRSAVVFGVRKMGKSSVLGRLREECPWPVALVDLEGYIGGLRYVYKEALHGWRAALRVAFPDLPLPEWTDDRSTLDPAAQAQAFRRAVVGLLDLLEDQPGRPGLFLFLDEIDALFDQPEYPEFAAVLRSVAEDPHCRGRFALLVAGLEPDLNRADRLNGGRNPFYAFFGEFPLWLLKPEDTRTMVVSIGGQMGISYEGDALDLLVEAGGGHPFLTRQLCSQAIRALERPGTVDRIRAAQAVEYYLRLARNYLAESLWGIDSGGPPPEEAVLLQSLAAAQPQPEEDLIPPDLLPEERRARYLALDHLRDQSLIRRVENGWELTIPLYHRWIRRYVLNLPDEAAEECDR